MSEAERQHQQAVAVHGEGNVDRAIALYRKAAKLDPALRGLQRGLGDAYLDRQRLVEALGCYVEALRQDPLDELACTGAASALREQGDVVAARQYFQRALRLRLQRWLLAPFRLFRTRPGG